MPIIIGIIVDLVTMFVIRLLLLLLLHCLINIIPSITCVHAYSTRATAMLLTAFISGIPYPDTARFMPFCKLKPTRRSN